MPTEHIDIKQLIEKWLAEPQHAHQYSDTQFGLKDVTLDGMFDLEGLVTRTAATATERERDRIREKVSAMKVYTLDEIAEQNKDLPSTVQEHAYHQSMGIIDTVDAVLAILATPDTSEKPNHDV